MGTAAAIPFLGHIPKSSWPHALYLGLFCSCWKGCEVKGRGQGEELALTQAGARDTGVQGSRVQGHGECDGGWNCNPWLPQREDKRATKFA